MNIQEVKKMRMNAKKDKDQVAANILTLVVGEFETQEKRGEQPDVVQIATKLRKSNSEVLDLMKGHREVNGSQIKKLTEENIVLENLLPKQLTDDELRDIISNSGANNIGMVMKFLGENYANQYDKKLASQLAKEYL